MRREPGALVDLVEKSLHGVLNCAHRDALAATAQKKSRPIPALPDRAQELVALRLVIPQRELRVVTDRDDSLLPALAANLHLLRQQIDVHSIDSAQLRQSHASRIEQLQDRAVPDVTESTFLRLQLGGLKEQLDLRAIEISRQIFVLLRDTYSARRIGIHLFVA